MEIDRLLTVFVCVGILFVGLVAVALQRQETQTQEFPEITQAITGIINVGFTLISFVVIFVSAAGIMFGTFAWLAGKT